MEMKFDPMTGEPIQTEANQEPEMKFDPMTGAPIAEKGRVSIAMGWKIGAVAVASVAVLGIAATQLVPRIMFGKNYKIVQAVGNTFESNHLMDNLSPMDIIDKGKYTATVDGSLEQLDVTGTFAINTSAKKVSLDGQASYSGVGSSMTVTMDDKEILVSIPDLTDQTLMYSYTEEKNGYLIDLLEDEGIDVEQFDESISSILSKSSSKEAEDVFRKATIKAVKTMDFEKTDKRKVMIDGKSRDCKGYTLELNEDLICDVCDIYEDAYDDYMQDMESAENLIDEIGGDPTELFDGIRDEAEYIDGDMSVYIYKKKLAAVVFDIDGYEVVLEFHGGNTRWENTTLEVEDEEVLSLSGDVDGKVESAELELWGTEGLSYEYNYKTGELELDIAGDEIELVGNVKKSGKSCTYILEDMKVEGDSVDCEGQLTIQKGAKLAKISKSNVFDIGNASESDWEDLGEALIDLIEDAGF